MKFKSETGQAVVELAVTLPIILCILCGIIDYGWLFFNKLNISNYSREATRYAIVEGSGKTALALTDAIRLRVTQIASINKDNLSVGVVFSDTSNINNGDVTVTISCDIDSLTFVTAPIATNGKINVDSKVTMRME